MSLEMLPDELLLVICSYLSAFDVLQAFNDLNVRLNYTISDYRRHINLTKARYSQFHQYCDMLLRSSLGLEIRSLSLSNSKPVMKQLTLFANRVWPLDQKLPNLERLTLIGINYDELNLFLPIIMRLEKLTELIITYDRESSDNRSIVGFFHQFTRHVKSLRRISLEGISQSLVSIFDWNNDTITHLTIMIQTIGDLVRLLQQFRALQFLSVYIKKFEANNESWCFDIIPAIKLNEFHLKFTRISDLPTFDQLICLLTGMPNLQRFKFEIILQHFQEDVDEVAYLNGKKWHLMRTQFQHLIDFDCSILCKLLWTNQYDDICQRIITSFSASPNWSAAVCQVDPYTHIYTYTKNRPLYHLIITEQNLKELNEHEVTALIDGASRLTLELQYCDNDDNETATEFSSLMLRDHIFPGLHALTVTPDGCAIFLDELLKSFLNQLFCQAPNLHSIEIYAIYDALKDGDILPVLTCLEKPSMSIKNCIFDVKGGYDQSLMEKVAFYLPMLTSLTMFRIPLFEELVILVNTCLTHFKHLLYLELGLEWCEMWKNQSYEKALARGTNLELWVKEDTLLGSSMMGRVFYFIDGGVLKIWL